MKYILLFANNWFMVVRPKQLGQLLKQIALSNEEIASGSKRSPGPGRRQIG